RLPTISSVSTADSSGSLAVPVCVRNTFTDLQIGRPPSLDGFFQERLVRSAPGSKVEEPGGHTEQAKRPDAPVVGPAAPVLLLAEALLMSAPGRGFAPYSAGSAGHGTGSCHPCAFIWKDNGCSSGADCSFCHLCDSGEKKRRQKEKKMVWRGIDRVKDLLRWS
ncbi:unnamed protein product, partial [Polarella glacialis]